MPYYINNPRMLNIILFGPPGAGKGTQSQMLIDKYKLVHLSTGDLLRNEIQAGTELGLKAKDFMNRGILVPDEVVIGMIEQKLKENNNVAGFIFDGFPRTEAQAESLDEMLAKNGTEISGLVALEVDEDELTQRILTRGMVSGRPDDQNEHLIKKRVKEYHEKTSPVADHYRREGKYRAIGGVGDRDEIFRNACRIIDSFSKEETRK